MMRRERNVKIVATLGPASSNREMIAKLNEAGADVFRINMSHTPHDKLRELVSTIRDVEAENKHPIGILVDLQGPKIRLGEVESGVEIRIGDHLRIDGQTDSVGNATRVALPHPEILAAIQPGHTLLVDDGKVRLKVESRDEGGVDAVVMVGGPLKSRKGVSLPDTLVPVSPLTDKDRKDLDYAVTLEIDWLALSFVQTPQDVAEVRKLAAGRAAIMSKIEKPQALEHLEQIVELSDGLMVARGDLGVELPLEKVPGVQKRLTRMSRAYGKPVVVATQMLESMIESPVPTRAEVSDVATAVYEGASAVMLSAESAAGAYPVEAVSTMNKIAYEVERDVLYPGIIYSQRAEPEPTAQDSLAEAARQVADNLSAKAIVCWTSTGQTSRRVARTRPRTPVIMLTPYPKTARRETIIWGVHCVVTENIRDSEDMVDRACWFAGTEGFAVDGERIVILAGVPFGTPGATNMLRIAYLGNTNR